MLSSVFQAINRKDRSMSLIERFTAAAILVIALAPLPTLAHDDAAGTVAPAFAHAIPNIPGKSLKAVVVTYPPGGKTPAHRHAPSAFITAYVLSGAIRSGVDGGAPKVFRTGESFTEPPGARHDVSENASAVEPASLLAIFVVDDGDKELTTIEK